MARVRSRNQRQRLPRPLLWSLWLSRSQSQPQPLKNKRPLRSQQPPKNLRPNRTKVANTSPNAKAASRTVLPDAQD